MLKWGNWGPHGTGTGLGKGWGWRGKEEEEEDDEEGISVGGTQGLNFGVGSGRRKWDRGPNPRGLGSLGVGG